MSEKVRPPKGFSTEAKRLWLRILEECHTDAASLLLIQTMCEALMRMREAQAIIKKSGILVKEKTDQGSLKIRTNPAIAVERDSRAALVRCWKTLGFDQEPEI